MSRWASGRTLAVLLCLGMMSSGVRAHIAAEGSARITYDFNSGWRLFVGDVAGAQEPEFDDSRWKPVTLPRAWNEDDAFRVDIRELPIGIAWYRKRFTLPDSDLGKKVYLEFEGVRHVADVYLNGHHIGRHENGVMAFGLDLTPHIKPGGNVVAVRVDSDWAVREQASNTPFQWNDRNFYANYGGINKRVWLHVTDKLHQTLPLFSNLGTTGVYVYASDFDLANSSATVTAESQVRNDHDSPRSFTYEVVLIDPVQGRELKRFAADAPITLEAGQTTTVKASARVSGLQFWSWGYGYLYDVTTRLLADGQCIDAVRIRTGFRKTEFGNGVVKLNGRVIHLHGYAQRTTNEWPALGTNVPAWLSDFSNGMMVAGNANLVRWMHVTPCKQDVQSCDRVGLMQAMPAGDSERDPGPGRRWQMRLELMRDAIIYNRNNPSIIFYEAGNAGIADDRMAEMVRLRDRYDPYGGRAMGCRNMLDSKVAEWGGDMLYVNRSASRPLWATEYSRDEGLRKYWDEFSPPYHKDGEGPPHRGQPAHAYNRNQDSHALENVRRWFDYYEQRPGTGDRVNAGGVNIIFSDTNTHHRGAENYRRSGEVDAMRLPKDGYFAHQVMWDGWVEPENPRIHIIGHWNYAPQVQKDIFVVSSAQQVQLLLNGRSLGFGQQTHRFLFTFKDVKWEPGVLQAVGFDAAGRQVCTDQRRTAGEPVALRLTSRTNPTGMRADGADVALFDVEVVDVEGNRCPTALNPVHFDLTGPGEWRGGIAQAPDNGILSRTLPVECGVNRVIVRSTTTPGTIELTASAEGLRPAKASVHSRAVAVEGGLSRELSESELACNLSRGPTPQVDSVRIVRRNVYADRVAAGSNQADIPKLCDDNEASAWVSDDQMDRAWVRFEFDQPVQVGEVILRLGSWRTTSWPLRLYADDREVFAGVAPATVGYSTLRFDATRCRTLRLQLAGAPRRGGNAPLIEVTGRADPHGGDDARAAGKFVIHEIELFAPHTPPASPAESTAR